MIMIHSNPLQASVAFYAEVVQGITLLLICKVLSILNFGCQVGFFVAFIVGTMWRTSGTVCALAEWLCSVFYHLSVNIAPTL